jgi:hypothetical protein
MSIAMKANIGQLLRQHMQHIYELKFPEYAKAKILLSQTILIAQTYFDSHIIYTLELSNIHFDSTTEDKLTPYEKWNEAYVKLIILVQAMLNYSSYSTEISRTEKKSNNFLIKALAAIAFISVSLWLWFFNDLTHWQWLNEHPKRISIYLGCQVLICYLTAIMIFSSEKHKNLISILAGLIIAIITIV